MVNRTQVVAHAQQDLGIAQNNVADIALAFFITIQFVWTHINLFSCCKVNLH